MGSRLAGPDRRGHHRASRSGPRARLSRPIAASGAAPRPCVTHPGPGRRRSQRARPAEQGGLPLRGVKPRAGEPRSLCAWHFAFALISRGRRLSACSSGPASSVEACHPRHPIIARSKQASCNAHSHTQLPHPQNPPPLRQSRLCAWSYQTAPGNVLTPACAPTRLYIVTPVNGSPRIPSCTAQLRPRIDSAASGRRKGVDPSSRILRSPPG